VVANWWWPEWQWDYIASRDDELSAKAGEVRLATLGKSPTACRRSSLLTKSRAPQTIMIAGEYKNAGWLWVTTTRPEPRMLGSPRATCWP
jgi:hypothetical protein